MSPIGVCIIGLGAHGIEQLTHLSRRPQMWTIAAVVDTSIAAYMRLKARHSGLSVPFFRDISEAMDSATPDVTLVSTHASSHVPIARTLIERNYSRYLLIEKPISNSVTESESLRAFINRQDWTGRAAVNFGRRCSLMYHRVRQMIGSGEHGALVRIEFVRPCKLAMKGIHYIDLGHWLMNSQATQVTAQLEEDSTIDWRGASYFDPAGCIDVSYENGAVMRVDTRSGLRGPFGMTIQLERATLFINEQETSVSIEAPGGATTGRIDSDKEADGYNWMENTLAALVHGHDLFAPSSLEQAEETLGLLVAAHVSHSSGSSPVTFPLSNEHKSKVLRIA